MSHQSNNIWAAVRLRPNQINKAEANLQRQGLDYLAPKIKVTKRQQNRFLSKITLLFPGYMFVNIDLTSDDLRKVNSTYGISHVVKVGGQIGKVPDQFIDALKSADKQVRSASKSALQSGDKVEVVHGPFAGLIAEVIRAEAEGRLRVLFDLLENKIKGSVSLNDVVLVK